MTAGGVVAGGGGKPTISGAKGFAIVFGAMLGVLLVLWVLASLAAP